MNTTGERIKFLRKKANLTQSELGDLLGVKKASIQKYENGSVVNLKTDTVELLAKTFDVTPSYILGWSDYDSSVDTKSLSDDVAFIEELHRRHGYAAIDFFEMCMQLNDDGRRRLMFYAEDILGNPKYSKE